MACHTLMFPPFGIAALAWLAPLPVLVLAGRWSLPWAVTLAWAIGTTQALLVNAAWLWPAMRSVFHLPGAVVAGMLVLEAQIIGGAPFAVLGLLLHVGSRLPALGYVLYAPAAWVAVEYLRGRSPLAAPWALLGAALSESALPVQVADLGGVYAVSFLAVLPAAALAALVLGRLERRALGAIGLGGLLVAVALAYGAYRLSSVGAATAAAAVWRVALVHGETGPLEGGPAPRALQAVDRHLALSPPPEVDVDLVVWPENAVGVLLEENPAVVERIAARAGGSPYLIGAPRLAGGPQALRASAFLIDAGRIAAVYDKRRLVPLAEQWGGGWRPLLGFGAGGRPAPIAVGGVRLGTSICFEAVFPELARADVRAGAELLVNLSNDAWFADAVGPRLHFLLGRLRAVETRRAVVRVANGGISALVMPDGSLAASDSGAPAMRVVSVPRLRGWSPYVWAGDAFAWLCIAATGIGLCRALRPPAGGAPRGPIERRVRGAAGRLSAACRRPGGGPGRR